MPRRIKYPLARLSPAKQELLVIEFARRHLDIGNTREMLEALAPLAESRENAERFEGRVTFFFSGWDEDSRETAEIPEIRSWFSDLTADFPYWLHFIEKEGDTFFHVLRLLCKGHIEQIEGGGMVGWRFDDMKQLSATVETLFCYMNLLHERLRLPEEMSERISQEVAQLIECSIE
jgi:hypothetical protein